MYNSIYPTYINSYSGVNNRQITKKEDEEKKSQSSNQAENNKLENSKHDNFLSSQSQNSGMASTFPNGEKVAIDYTKRQVHIDQVLSDFKNTANAIGAPDDIKAEVNSYLELIETQAQKENPNKQIIQSNLKNASQILDEYITNTLKKQSNVVENWVDALFLQQIDYKSEKTPNLQQEEPQTVEAEIVEEPAEEQQIQEEQIVEQQEEQASQASDIYVPNDPQLKRMFIQAKKYAAIDQKEKALYAFQNTMDYAEETGDYQACAMIHFEEGRLYDDFNQVEDALYNYDRAVKQTSDNNIKAKAHIYMGKIYDDYVKFEPAVEHYTAAVSFSGESDNLKLQTQALNNLAEIHTGRYDKKNALMFMDMSSSMADETNDERVKGIINGRNARFCEKLDENARALNYYGVSSEAYSNTEDNESLAKNYQNAAEIMFGYGNSAKAKKLLSKAYIAAYKTDNDELKTEITHKLASL